VTVQHAETSVARGLNRDKLTTDRHEESRGLSATAWLLVPVTVVR